MNRTHSYIYQAFDHDNGLITVHSDEYPKINDNIIEDSIKVRTPFVDCNGEPIYTGDVVKHYIDPHESPWAYDMGLVFYDESEGKFRRTSIIPLDDPMRSQTIVGDGSFSMSEKCMYLILGDTKKDSLADIAVRLWLSLSQYQKEAYYCDNGIIGFLEEFRITPDDKGLSSMQIEYALDSIDKYSTIY